MHRYLSGNTKVILRLKRVSVVNSHWLYPSLMTYMLNKFAQSYGKRKILICTLPVSSLGLSVIDV